MQFHPETVQSAIDRYANEIERVLGVVELHLESSGHQHLVGNKASYADLMWVPWNDLLFFLMGPEFDYKGKFPKTFDWNERLNARDGVKNMRAAKAKELGA